MHKDSRVRGHEKYIFYRWQKRKNQNSKTDFDRAFGTNLLSILSFKIVFILIFCIYVADFFGGNQKKYVENRHTRNHQSWKVISAAIFISRILLPKVISGNYFYLRAYINFFLVWSWKSHLYDFLQTYSLWDRLLAVFFIMLCCARVSHKLEKLEKVCFANSKSEFHQ